MGAPAAAAGGRAGRCLEDRQLVLSLPDTFATVPDGVYHHLRFSLQPELCISITRSTAGAPVLYIRTLCWWWKLPRWIAAFSRLLRRLQRDLFAHDTLTGTCDARPNPCLCRLGEHVAALRTRGRDS